MEYMDTDAGYQLGSWQNLRKTVKESMTRKRDYVINNAVRSTDSNYLLCRDQDYVANKVCL